MNRLFFLIKISLILIIINIIAFISIAVYTLWLYSPELPSYDKIKNYQPSLASRVYTSDGLILKKFYIEERIFVPINRIPKTLINAFLAAEDKKFYDHVGIDFIAIIRASITNLINKFTNKKLIGASTITQQVVKNLLLSNEVSFERKIKEIILAIRIENILSKDQILELYLNDIYLGYGSYGVAAASLNYFNKSLNELGLHEMAFLAALPKAPNNYNPKKNYDAALIRRNWVIERMHQNNLININDLNYKYYPIKVMERYESNYNSAEYFNEEIRKFLYKKYGEKKLYSDGLIIKTTIDTKLQNIADETLYEGLLKYDQKQGWRGVLENTKNLITSNEFNQKKFINPFPNKWKIVQIVKTEENLTFKAISLLNKNYIIDLKTKENAWLRNERFNHGDIVFIEEKNNKILIRQIPEVNGALIALNPHNGNILSLSGGFSFKLSEFNRVTQAKRQPGSAFKPFVYITALKEGYNPSTLILDAPYVVDQGPGLPKWKPANYTEEFYGLSTMRTGIEKSRNLMTIRLADKIGMDKILITSKEFKIDKYIDDKLSMSLGSGLVTLMDITNAYGMIVNGGKEINPIMIKSIYSKEGKRIFHNDFKNCNNCKLNKINSKIDLPTISVKQNEVLDSRIAYQITSMLEGVVLRGTGKKIKNLDIPLGGKTGTTNDNKDAWFIGFSPDIVIGIYVGHDIPKSLGYKQTGSSVAVPIFKTFIEKAKINQNRVPFRIPSGLSFVKINPKTGLPSTKQESILEPYLYGNEPFNSNNLNILDSLGSINNDSISGTGSLLDN
tara:strand:+ start:4126 stop:6489 length:2364 start_codon:yes stop_codon:yes gene_type:complete